MNSKQTLRLAGLLAAALCMPVHAQPQEPAQADASQPVASSPAAPASEAAAPLVPSAPATLGQPQARFFLTPHVEGLDVCDEAQADTHLTNMAKVRRVCQGLGTTAAGTLSHALDALEPGGAHGAVQVGYTLTVPLLGMFRREGEDWVIDDAKLNMQLALIEQVDRPVVVYLSSSHFDTIGPLPAALREDPRNFMQYADGSVPELGYFGFPIAAYTLLTDPEIPVNRYRLRALREIAARILALPEEARARIVGYTLGGELHQMYPDFENGAGRFDKVQVTDYSPGSVAAFRAWLADKWGSVRKLNAAMGMSFDDFEAIDAPRGNQTQAAEGARAVRSAAPLANHYSAYASGYVPVAGWVHDPQARIAKLTMYLNGRPLGEVQRGYNRLDVYRAREDVLTPNVGYRYDIDVSDLAPGQYLAQVVAEVDGLNYELAQARFSLAGRQDALRERDPRPARRLQEVQEGNWLQRWWRHFLRTIGLDRSVPVYAHVPGVDTWMDMPPKDLVVRYNPLAREWDAFRNAQVLAYMQTLYDVAIEAGLPENDLYSHQINDRVNSSWNAQLFAIDDVWASRQDWHAGMNLYGGGTRNDLVMQLIRRNRLADFASPEFHPQQWKRPDDALKALQAQRDAGARFVSPYYLGLMPKHLRGGQVEQSINRMELTPGNPKEGSDQFYKAIQTLAAE